MSIPPAFSRRPGESVTGQYHPTSGYLFGRGETLLDKLRKDPYEGHRKLVPYYPFQDEGEWELAKFLSTHLTQAEMNEFLRLKWVSRDSSFQDHCSELPLGIPVSDSAKTIIQICSTVMRMAGRLTEWSGMEVHHIDHRELFDSPTYPSYLARCTRSCGGLIG